MNEWMNEWMNLLNCCRRRRRRVHLAFLLLFVHCATWLLQILTVNIRLTVVQYLFAAAKSSQGLLFLLAYCVLDDKVTHSLIPSATRYLRQGCDVSIPVAPCGLRGCKNWPAPFPGRMSYKATKPGLVSVLYLSMCYMVLLFIRAPFLYC